MASKLYINTENIKNNINFLKSKIKNSTKIIAMVKANAYGCGIVQIPHLLEKNGITDFGVALVSEGVKLRKTGIKSNILVTSQFLESDFEDIIKYNLIVSVSNLEMIKKLNIYATYSNSTVKIHLKIDSGMGRLGFDENNIYNSIEEIKNNCNNILIDGIYTHLSCADTDLKYTLYQLNKFDSIVKELKSLGYSFNYIHALNSSGILKFPQYQYTHVRSGILVYGYMPDKSITINEIKPCLSLKAPILRINEITKDCKISYGATHTAKKGTKIATIQIGYADGLSRACSNKYSVYIGNTKCKIVGNICMDMCMIDITDIEKNVNIGDEVTIFKNQSDIQEIADLTNTINYEIISRLNERIERILI